MFSTPYRRKVLTMLLNGFVAVGLLVMLGLVWRLSEQQKHSVSLAFWGELIRQSPAAVMSIDMQSGLIMEWNASAERYFGWSYGEARTKTFHELLVAGTAHPAFTDCLRLPHWMEKLKTTPASFTATLIVRNGKRIKIRGMIYNIAPVGNRLVFVCVPADLLNTPLELKKTESILLRPNEPRA